MNKAVLKEFGSYLSEICSRGLVAEGRPIIWTIIANPKAGGFTIKSRWKSHRSMLQRSAELAAKNPLRRQSGPSLTALREGGTTGKQGLILTMHAGHAGQIANTVIREAASYSGVKPGDPFHPESPFYLIITAGGDGTSLDVMNSLYYAPRSVRRDFAVLRLPMGTGNDGSDFRELDKSLELLIMPSEIQHQKAIRLSTASNRGPFLAFNILSLGLDAFVTHMTNKMKGKLPGDSYKLWVDIAALFYDHIYKVDYSNIKSFNIEGDLIKEINEKLLLIAVGESGNRCYGAQQWILPDDRNICAVKQMSLFRKFLFKELFKNGNHADQDESILWSGHKVEYTSPHFVLAQTDGETIFLDKHDYPAVIELTEPCIPILKPKYI